MIRRPPRSTRTDTLFPSTTLFRSREPIADLIGRHARYSDLAILGQPDPDDPLSGAPEVAEDVILGGGRPVLMVPYIGTTRLPGRKLMVAWDAGREAARAVADAMAMLVAAEQVQVVIVNPKRGPKIGRAHV